MKLKTLSFGALLCVVLLLCSCGNETPTTPEVSGTEITQKTTQSPDGKLYVPFYNKIAREIHTDGWVFSFIRYGMKNGDDSGVCKYAFNGINLRYRYAEKLGKTSSAAALQQGFMLFGTGSEAEKRDMALIESILSYDKSDADLLALNPDDYSFETLNREMFFGLMKTALLGEPQKEGDSQLYWDKPAEAILTEPAYIDGYKFQICFLGSTGLVDELYIDVLYKTGNGKLDYSQLSDLVDSGAATDEQIEAFHLIKDITDKIKENESFITDADTYRNRKIGEIDFSRMYTFLENIHNNKFNNYVGD